MNIYRTTQTLFVQKPLFYLWVNLMDKSCELQLSLHFLEAYHWHLKDGFISIYGIFLWLIV